MNYYNEIDPYCCEWLRNLIANGLIGGGYVDSRSIKDVQPEDLIGFKQCHFFAGIGGWDYALQLAGWPEDREIWTGSCPCQPYSIAGKKEGNEDERNLWPEFYRLISVCKPECIFGEQVEGAVKHGWLDGIFTDLESQNYSCGAAVLGAHSVSKPHIRQRIYWMAQSECGRRRKDRITESVDGLHGQRKDNQCAIEESGSYGYGIIHCLDGKTRRIEPGTCPLAYGVPARVGELRAYGNAIVPQVAAEFIDAYMKS